MGKPCPKYTAEFKQQAVRPYDERGATCAEVAREMGADPSSPADWVGRADASAAPPEGDPFKVAEENRRLRRENERPRRESGMLLEASAFLAGGRP